MSKLDPGNLDAKDSRLVFHEVQPPNSETPLALLRGGITPLPLFFTRNNFEVPPAKDPATFRLKIDGLVARPLELDLARLEALPSRRLVAVLECTGNSRSRFAATGPAAEGVPWGEGAIANTEWKGVPCHLLLEEAGAFPGALQAECRGAGLVRGVDLTKLLADGLFAYEMNGEKLSHLHGGPVRLVVPGWGGINWVKWLERLTLIDHESASSYNRDSYVIWGPDGEDRGRATEMPLKSVFTSPAEGSRLEAGKIALRGLAWSPGIPLEKVEVSLDGGQTWEAASFRGEDQGPYAWREFTLEKTLPPGHHQLLCRATDHEGRQQPATVPFNRKGYLMNAWHRLSLEIA